MTEEDDLLLSPEHLGRYDVPGAPDGFSTRVMARIATESKAQRDPRPRWWWWPVLAAAVLALVITAGVIVVGPRRGSEDATGARVAAVRETIGLGSRGVAVAERGAELRWNVHGGDAVIEQSAGIVFYRVEHGGPFEVRTPLGVVSVTGTCFTVEVSAMKNPIKSDVMKGAAIGAALATAVVVTVYEGRVAVANPMGSLQLSAGETSVVQPGAAPAARGTTTAALDPQAAALADARAQIKLLEDQLHKLHADSDVMSLKHQQDAGRYYAPSQDALREMAETCWVAFDEPPLGTERDPVLVADDLASEVGVSSADRDAINRAYRALHDRDLDTVRHLYMELTGADAEAATALSLDALEAEIDAKSPPEDEIAGRRRFARERAGLEPAPSPAELAHRPAIERLLRIRAALGNDAESIAAGVVGAQRARELRSHDGSPGWNHTVADYGGCNDHF